MDKLRFWIDPGTGLPDIQAYNVTEEEVRQVLSRPGEEGAGRQPQSRVRMGQTDVGRFLLVAYIPDPDGQGALVITASEVPWRKGRPYWNPFAEDLASAKAFARFVGVCTNALLVKVPEGQFAVPVDDMYVSKTLRSGGRHAAAEFERLKSLCSPDTRLLEVGAHVGVLAIPLARLCGQVVAVEANPRTVELLKINVLLNGLTNCRVIHKAASDKAAPIEFLLSRVHTGRSTRMPLVKSPIYFFDNPEVTTVAGVPLDDLLPDETFDIIVMDIEGSEAFALRGMRRLLEAASVLQVEFMPLYLEDVAGVNVADFVGVIEPYFASLLVPERPEVVGRDRFLAVLSDMYAREESSDGLLFFKASPEFVSRGLSSALAPPRYAHSPHPIARVDF